MVNDPSASTPGSDSSMGVEGPAEPVPEPGPQPVDDDGTSSWAGETVASFALAASDAGESVPGASAPGASTPGDSRDADLLLVMPSGTVTPASMPWPYPYGIQTGTPMPTGMPPTTRLTQIPEGPPVAEPAPAVGPVSYVSASTPDSTPGRLIHTSSQTMATQTAPLPYAVAPRPPPMPTRPAPPLPPASGLARPPPLPPPARPPPQHLREAQAGVPPTQQAPPPGLAPRPLGPISASTPDDAVAQLVASTLLMQEDIPAFREHFSTKMAHAWLASLRQDCAQRGIEAIDLSEDPRWRQYICSHPKAREIISQGIIRFEGRFCNSLEPNRAQLRLPPPFGHLRFDFFAVRGDGTACRLHPSQKADAQPTHGAWDSWRLPHGTSPPPGASTPGPQGSASSSGLGIHTAHGGMAQNYNRVDIISAELALRTLTDKMHAWRQAGQRDEDVREDLLAGASTPGGWEWHRFLMGRPWGEALFQERVTSIFLVVLGGQPALEVTTAARPLARFITWSGNKAKLSQ